MKTTQVRTLCECQALLIAIVDENLNVTAGTCEDSHKRQLRAPACRAFKSQSQLGVSFACPLCTRNVLRTFSLSKLAWTGQHSVASQTTPAVSSAGQ